MEQARQVIATAPGKLILMGEHAVVYGRPALAAALDLRTRVRLARRDDTEVRLELADLGIERRLDASEVARCAEQARAAWRAYDEAPGAATFAALSGRDPGHFVAVAIGEAARVFGAAPAGLEIEIASELPVGAGFGSSASVAVAVVGALAELWGVRAGTAAIAEVALEVERRQHGRPSGIDHTTVLRGGVVWAERRGERLAVEPLELAPGALDGIAVLHTGSPAETTAELVEAVRRRFAGRPAELDSVLDAIAEQVVALRGELATGPSPERLRELLATSERLLESLGVVPGEVRRVIREVERRGGAAKVSGAGGLAGPAAGSLLAYHPERPVLELECLAAYRPIVAELGGSGLEIEPGA